MRLIGVERIGRVDHQAVADLRMLEGRVHHRVKHIRTRIRLQRESGGVVGGIVDPHHQLRLLSHGRAQCCGEFLEVNVRSVRTQQWPSAALQSSFPEEAKVRPPVPLTHEHHTSSFHEVRRGQAQCTAATGSGDAFGAEAAKKTGAFRPQGELDKQVVELRKPRQGGVCSDVEGSRGLDGVHVRGVDRQDSVVFQQGTNGAVHHVSPCRSSGLAL